MTASVQLHVLASFVEAIGCEHGVKSKRKKKERREPDSHQTAA